MFDVRDFPSLPRPQQGDERDILLQFRSFFLFVGLFWRCDAVRDGTARPFLDAT